MQNLWYYGFVAMKQTKVGLITIVFIVEEMSNLLSSYFLPTFYHLKAFLSLPILDILQVIEATLSKVYSNLSEPFGARN